MLLLSAFLVPSCNTKQPEAGLDIKEDPYLEDSTTTAIAIKADGDKIRNIDIFIYSTKGTQVLEKHISLTKYTGSLDVVTTAGEKKVAVIANSPYRFNLAALSKFESIEQMEYSFEDDSPEFPIMGGSCITIGNVAQVTPLPLLNTITLTEISCGLDDYETLESPRIRLKDFSRSARILQTADFHPKEAIDSGKWMPLPHDVGLFTQQPGTILYCYPDETPETTLGTPHTIFELECFIGGKKCSYEIRMPPAGRNVDRSVEMTINAPDEYTFKVH